MHISEARAARRIRRALGYAFILAAFVALSCGEDGGPGGGDQQAGGSVTGQSGGSGQSGETSNAGTSNAGMSNGGMSNGGTSNGGTSGMTSAGSPSAAGGASNQAGQAGVGTALTGGSTSDAGSPSGGSAGEAGGSEAGSPQVSAGAEAGGSAGTPSGGSAGAAGVDCDCARGAYVPVCGIDGMTYDAACGTECVPVEIACRGECPCTGALCGGVECGDGEECCGPADCGYCIPIGTDPACAGSCQTRPCGDVECLEPSLGYPGQVCLQIVITSGPTETTNYECARNPCDRDGVDCGCAGNLCQAANPVTACEGPTGDDEALLCIGGGPCNSPDTPIATPTGGRPIASLRTGDLVYSVDHGALVAVPLLGVAKTPVRDHRVVRLVTETGSVLEISPGHPTADGRTIGDLSVGDRLDGQRVVSRALVPYTHPFTYDILPDSETGTYVAGGMLIGSTLHRE